jgi:penicillin-binding protein 1B
VSIDPQTGLRGGMCPGALELPFVKGSAPEQRAPCAGDATIEAVGKAVDAVKESVAPIKSWLERIFGK